MDFDENQKKQWKAGVSMGTLFLACRTLVYAGAFVALWLAIALSLGGSPIAEQSSWPSYSGVAGIALMAAGGALALTCIALFVVRGRGTPAVFDAPRRFVAVGPYRYVRNPMYWGGGTALVGLGLYRRSLPILIFCAGWFLLFHLLVVYYEEPVLRRKFGGDYEEYCRHVRRWLPRLARTTDASRPRSVGHA